jgi:muconolactone delta-isomerase
MLFLVISEPTPVPPSSVNASRKRFWEWVQPLIDKGEVRSIHAKVGRGAAALFDVPSNEALHAHLNGWADIIPARFDVHALIDPAKARAFLEEQGG